MTKKAYISPKTTSVCVDTESLLTTLSVFGEVTDAVGVRAQMPDDWDCWDEEEEWEL